MIGEAIVRLREEAGVTQSELARRAGMNRAQLCVVEKGRQLPKPETRLLAFKAHFGVSAEAFALRLEELSLIAKPLRQKFRTLLRVHYKSHPTAMEPEPNLRPIALGQRERILAERSAERS